MERLTYWNETTKRYEVNDNGIIHYGSIADRLATYEDTELEPCQIESLKGWKTELIRRLCKSELETATLKKIIQGGNVQS